MWDGSRQGSRGGPPFRGGDHRGEMFGGRDGPMPDFRGRDGMNMGPMGPRHLDLPPMDMRRMDGPPDMRGRDMDPHDMRGREPNRDFHRPGEETDFSLRRQYEVAIRDKLINASGFTGPGRNLDMGGRGLPPREPNRFMDMRDREMFHCDMPRFNNPDMDGRRGFPMDPMGRNDGFRDMRDRPPMGMDDIDGCSMDMPPRERGMMDFDRRGGPPFNARGGFDSDMDFRNRPGPSAEFRDRERSPLRFGNIDGGPMDKGRSDMPPDFSGPNRLDFVNAEGPLRKRDFLDSRESSPIDYRSGEEMTLAEEWKSRRKEKTTIPAVTKDMGGVTDQSFPLGFGREGDLRDPLLLKDRDRPSVEFPVKPVGFPRGDHLAPVVLPLIGRKGPQDIPFPAMGLLPSSLGRENDSKRWLGDRDPKQNQNASNRDERPLYHQEKNLSSQVIQGPNDPVKGPKDMPHDQGPERSKLGTAAVFQSGNTQQGRDQDYRDIDYRTASGRAFDYKREDFQVPEKALKEPKPIPPSKFSDSGSQDQDYRSASVKEKVTNTISIIGIPKTATMEQILGAFAIRDGVPMQGMKIKSVVPGYSYDTAYVEFLNLEDAVHFMESNKGSLKVGTKTASMKYIQPDKSVRDTDAADPKGPQPQGPLLPSAGKPLDKAKSSLDDPKAKGVMDALSQGEWQRNSNLTPEAWQQQMDQQLRKQESEQQAEAWASRNPPRHGPHQTDPVFKESKTMIIKNVKPTTTVETILKALDPFAYLDERNVRLVKGKPPGAKCFCFVDMDSHEQVTRLVELLTKPRPLSIDGVRVYAEVAKPLKNPSFKRDSDKPNSSLLGYPPETNMMAQQQQQQQPYSQSLQFSQPLQPPVGPSASMQGDSMAGSMAGSMGLSLPPDSSYNQVHGVGYGETPTVDPSYQAMGAHVPVEAAGMTATGTASDPYVFGSEIPDMTNYLFDATSGFYYDPQTTLYYDPNSRYFYNAQTQDYLYWDALTKTYIPVPGGSSTTETQSISLAAEVQAILSNPAADAPLEMKKPSEPTPVNTTVAATPPPAPAPVPVPVEAPAPPQAPVPAPAVVPASDPASTPTPIPEPEPSPASTAEKREEEDAAKKDKEKDGKEEKPRSLAAFKIMKDMERWAKIQNRQKDGVRSPSPVLKTGGQEDRRTSKAADAGFAIFERKGVGGDDLFKKPLAPPKKDEKGKRSIGSLGLLASDYAAGSDEEVEEEKHEAPRSSKGQSEDKDDKLTDWKKMACLLCRRQFPTKDALIRHQQLSDLHKQNMEIHLKIKRSKKELEALENQEKELNARESTKSPEQKRRKQHHQPQQHHHNTWAGSSRDTHKGSERPGLGAEPVEKKKKEPVVWDHATYKQAVRKAMFARFKELE